jgi:hypothetical protein
MTKAEHLRLVTCLGAVAPKLLRSFDAPYDYTCAPASWRNDAP